MLATPTSVAPASGAEWARVVGLAVVLVTILTYPTVPGLLTMGRLDTGDGRFSIWNVGWIDHALTTNPRHLFDANIFYPHTGTLAYSELNLVAGLLGLPAFVVTKNALAAHNSAVVLGFLLTFVCTWALVRRLTGSGPAGLVSATAFTFCPFLQSHTAHIQLLMAFSLPLTFLAFDRLREDPSTGRAIALGAAVVVMGLSCAYYGIYGGAALGVAALLLARPGRRYWIALGIAVAVAAALTAPVLLPYAHAREASGVAQSMVRASGGAYAATVGDYLTSPAIVHGWFSRGAAECTFPGMIALALALTGAVLGLRKGETADRRIVAGFLAIAALSVWASFGSQAGLYDLLQVVPGASLLRAPVRFGAVVMLAVAVLAGFGVKHLASSRAWLAPALVAGLALELAAVPWPLQDRGPIPRAFEMLAVLPPGPVVEFHFPYHSSDFHNHTHAMFNSTFNWQPLVNGYSDLTPPEFESLALAINDFPDAASFELMHKLQVRYVVFKLDDYRGEARDRLLARFPPYEAYMRRLTLDRNVWLYEITSWPAGTGGQ
ncbi:MAG: hypothetical protein ACHQO8_04980 [Vicinamibacterales bacterium]